MNEEDIYYQSADPENTQPLIFINLPKHVWKYKFNNDDALVVFCTSNPPNWFHRLTMKYILNVWVEVL